MGKVYGAQSQTFGGLISYIGACKPAVWKAIDPDSDFFRTVKQVSPSTVTIARVYTGQASIDDAAVHPDPEQYGRDYATLVYSRVADHINTDLYETENEPVDNHNNLTEFIKRLNAFLVGFSRRAKELGFRPLGPNFSTGYPEVYVPGSDYQLWPNAWQGLSDGLLELKLANGALGLHEYDSPDLFRYWSDAKQLGYLVGRHKAIYRCLPPNLQDLPLYLTEFEIDWLTQGIEGGFWHNGGTPEFMVDQMRLAWKRIFSTTPQLKGICFFLWRRNDPRWEEYDIGRTSESEQIFANFFAEELPTTVPQPPVFKFTHYPLPKPYPITQGFGENPQDYARFGLPGHEGIDLGCPTGIPVLSVTDGTVVQIGNDPNTYGLFVRVNHVDNWQTTYAHLNSTAAIVGQQVQGGQLLGVSNNTGNSTGPHLHLTLKHLGHTYTDSHGTWPYNIFDPTDYLEAVTEGNMSTPEERMHAAWNSTGVDFNPEAALYKFAQKNKLGFPVGNEYSYFSSDGKHYTGQGYAAAIVEVVTNDWANAHAYNWLDGQPYTPGTPQPPTAWSCPVAIGQVGGACVESTNVGAEYFEIMGATARQGVSAFCVVTVLGKDGAPLIGKKVVNLFRFGLPNGEVGETDGNGVARFQFGASSAFTNPGDGPFQIFVADDAAYKDFDSVPKTVHFTNINSRIINSLGDFAAQHTEIYLQFKQQK